MRLKSFHGSTVGEAMRQVRDALGEDAIIVATREDDAGGVRVTAAIDDTVLSTPIPPVVASPDTDLMTHIADALNYHGVDAGLTETLLGAAAHYAKDDALLALAAACDAHVAFRPLTLDAPARPIMVVGPPGAGKTLTIARLAAEARLRNQPVTVITTDLVRAGGLEQISAFTRLLKIRLLEIEQPESVADIISEIAGRDRVLIDTAGRNPYHAADRAELNRMVGKTRCAIALVLGCGQDKAEGIDLARAFSSLGADHLILTRVDLARRLGAMVSIAQASGLALAGFSQSPNAADPLQPFDPIVLARCLMQPPGLLQDALPPPRSAPARSSHA